MNLDNLSFLRVTKGFVFKPFNCEDDDLNEFLFEEAIPFYQRMGFEFLSNNDKEDSTRLMFLDLADLEE